jgi:hypothetical protein
MPSSRDRIGDETITRATGGGRSPCRGGSRRLAGVVGESFVAEAPATLGLGEDEQVVTSRRP